MKKTIIATALGAFLVGGAGIAIAAQTEGKAPPTRAELVAKLDQRFAKLDTDGDGRITAEERAAQKAARAQARFDRLDADKNGQISRAEFDAAGAKRAEMRGKFAGKHGGGKMRHRGGFHAMVDADKDGVVTKQEFQARALERFDRLDTDKDGQISAAEREAARAAWKAKRGQ